jgi:phosphoribosylaminoimidazole carboxylase
LRLIQDKYLQKEHFSKHNIPIADLMSIEQTLASPQEAADKFDFPFMVKSRKYSYDGRGNLLVSSEEDFGTVL